MLSCFVEDGYTESHTVPERAGIYARLAFTGRRAMASEVQRVIDGTANDEEREKRICSLLAKHIVSWDAKDRSGQPVPITDEVMGKIVPSLRSVLVDWVCSWVALEDDAKN